MMNDRMHAYVDGQMDALERRRFERQMAQDAQLAREVAELQAIKRMVQDAYGVQDEAKRGVGPGSGRSGMMRNLGKMISPGVAAALLLGVMVGLLSGWWLGRDVPPAMQQVVAGDHVILHIDRYDAKALNQLLARAEQLSARHVSVTLVANAEAVKLFSVRYSPAPQRIERFLDRHRRVNLVVCRRALHNLAKQGMPLNPLPGARTDLFALDYIVQGVERGWKYQKI